MSSLKKERNYWPHAIVLVLLFMVFAVSVVLKIAFDNPVQMDSYYFEKYQKVDEDINTIINNQKKFDERFKIVYETKKFKLNSPNSFEFKILNKDDSQDINSASIELLITRPDKNDFNKKYNLTNSDQNGIFKIEDVMIELPGRWQILTKIKIGEYSSFNKYEINATK